MRSSLVMLAGLAGSALAYPADVSNERRTFGLVAEILGSIGSDIDTILSGVLGLGGHSQSSGSLLVGLSAHGAAALEGGLLGCGATKIHADARVELKTWLSSQTVITGSLKTHLLSWCEGSVATLEESVIAALSVYIPTCAELAAKESIFVTIDGIVESSEYEATLVLSASAQASLTTFISAHAELDVDIKAGLNLCAAGGIIGSLHADIKASLLAWVSGSDCGLEVGLKASVLAWIKGEAATDLVAIGSISTDVLTSLSVGASIEVLVEESGVLSTGALASIAAYLEADVEIDVNVRAALKACAEGKLAAALDVDLRTSLALWLTGSSCSLGVELKAVVLLWLSVAVTAEASVDIVTGLLVDITGFLTEEIISLLSVNLRGALGLLIAGESLTVLSWEARAELAAFLGGCTSIDISVTIEIIIIEWFTGCSIPGGPSGGGSPSGSSSAPSLPSPTGPSSGPAPSGSGSIPSGPGATSSVPSGPAPSGSGSIPSGPGATSSVPSGPAPSGSGSIPSGPGATSSVPSGPAPSGSGSIPSGPGATSSVPSGPAPSGSGSIPSGPGATSSVPSGPAPSGPSGGGSVPSGPGATSSVPSGPAPSGSGSIPSGPGATSSVPSGPAPSGSGSIPSGPGATSSVPSGPAPSGPSGSGPATTGAPAPSGSGGAPGSGCTTETLEWTTAITETLSGAWSTGYTETISTAWSTGWTETVPAWSTGYTETIPAPAPTSAPSGSGSVPGGPETVTVTKTVCGCE
ncbi:hypothetical protein N7478_001769 [Penicillium angulare]|uniref:uncharacterized protein n=1 Tax=Penicillium angulare TaxID=116970 RepID=UPI00253FAD3A|nr:uncharacterized protein N7478_001769 [Penicillium angulare]KAJ5288739.1 hypothetical protein N7478_001769 [Penicillium angulare]